MYTSTNLRSPVDIVETGINRQTHLLAHTAAASRLRAAAASCSPASPLPFVLDKSETLSQMGWEPGPGPSVVAAVTWWIIKGCRLGSRAHDAAAAHSEYTCNEVRVKSDNSVLSAY